MKPNKLEQGKDRESPTTSSSKKYKIICTPTFLSEAKKLLKKYPNIKEDFLDLKNRLKTDPTTGNDFLGDNIYKVRMPIADKGKGQSGGARVIIEVIVADKEVYVISVYDKSVLEAILHKTLHKLIKKSREENK